MGKVAEIEMTVKVEVKLPVSGASAGELALALGPVRNEIGRELMRLTVESVRETIVGRERLPRRAARHGPWTESSARCRCTSFTKQGRRRTRRRLRTSLGEVGFRARNVQCRRCGVKYSPVLRFFDVGERKRRLSVLEGIIAEVVAVETYGKTERLAGDRGYENARGCLQGAMAKVFTQVETWLATGLVMPGTICTLERITRESGRRLKKLGYGWSDEGITRVAEILLKKVYEPEYRDRYREKRADLRGRCPVVLQEVKVTRLSIVGW